MGSSEDEKVSSNSSLDVVPQSRLQQWFASTSEFLTHWGIETNGSVFSRLFTSHFQD